MSNEPFTIAILAGGLASRLRPLTDKIPKSLIPICNKPYIHHQLILLQQKGIKNVVICTGYLNDQIKEYVKTGAQYHLNVQYSTDGATLLGTGGAIKKALPLLGENFFVIYGDSYLDCDYLAIQNYYSKKKNPGLMTVYKNKDQWGGSNIEYDNNEIIQYSKASKTPEMLYIDYGLSLYNNSIFDEVEEAAFDLTIVNQLLLRRSQMSAYKINKRFYEVGSHQGIHDLEQHLS